MSQKEMKTKQAIEKTCCSEGHWEETDRYFGSTDNEPEEFYVFYDSLCCKGRQFVDTYRLVKTEER